MYVKKIWKHNIMHSVPVAYTCMQTHRARLADLTNYNSS